MLEKHKLTCFLKAPFIVKDINLNESYSMSTITLPGKVGKVESLGFLQNRLWDLGSLISFKQIALNINMVLTFVKGTL